MRETVSTDACPILKPTRAQFEKPFLKYASDYFRKNPNVPIIKVIPPAGFKARSKPYDLENMTIETPIQQRVLMHDNRPGHYDCVLLAQPKLTVKQFEEIARERGGPKQGLPGDELHERAFWSSLTVKPPLYGADTPLSLFDEDVKSGWNLRKLGCLLSKYNVTKVPGVTTPMTYFGMWKSFFSWHVEDADLLSINYLHFGASKVWYAVAPGTDRRRFEELAKGLFPKDAARCAAFLRHKSFMITPQLLKKHGIPYVKVKHNPGEFVILNAGAYHAGYNQGFNCAEAVNFATEDWIPLGQEATRCDCNALGKDAVRLNMSVFPGCDSSTEESSSQSDSDGDSIMSDAESMEEPSSGNQGRQQAKPKAQPIIRKNPQERAEGRAVKRGPGRPRKDPVAEDPQPSRGPGRPPKQLAAVDLNPPMRLGRPPKQPIGEEVKSPRGPGRPRKHPLDEDVNPPRGSGRPQKQPRVDQVKEDAPAVKRGPGRPRKTDAEQRNQEASPVKRGPGRPRKADAAQKIQEAAPVKRGPGRPRKADAEQTTQKSSPVNRGPGRPRKADTEQIDREASPAKSPAKKRPVKEEAPAVKRGPGRPKKSDTAQRHQEEAAPAVKRGPGRPRKADIERSEPGQGHITQRQVDGRRRMNHADAAGMDVDVAEGKGKGKKRQRSDAAEQMQSDGMGPEAQLESPEKKSKTGPAGEKVTRPRGRPRKYPLSPEQAANADKAQALPRQESEEPAEPMNMDMDVAVEVRARPQSGQVARPDSQGVTGVVGQPYVIVGQDDSSGSKFFYLVQKLSQPARRKGDVSVRWLVEGSDGLYYPHDKTWDEKKGSLIEVRTQACKNKAGEAAFRLLTMRSKIYDVELSD